MQWHRITKNFQIQQNDKSHNFNHIYFNYQFCINAHDLISIFTTTFGRIHFQQKNQIIYYYLLIVYNCQFIYQFISFENLDMCLTFDKILIHYMYKRRKYLVQFQENARCRFAEAIFVFFCTLSPSLHGYIANFAGCYWRIIIARHSIDRIFILCIFCRNNIYIYINLTLSYLIN